MVGASWYPLPLSAAVGALYRPANRGIEPNRHRTRFTCPARLLALTGRCSTALPLRAFLKAHRHSLRTSTRESPRSGHFPCPWPRRAQESYPPKAITLRVAARCSSPSHPPWEVESRRHHRPGRRVPLRGTVNGLSRSGRTDPRLRAQGRTGSAVRARADCSRSGRAVRPAAYAGGRSGRPLRAPAARARSDPPAVRLRCLSIRRLKQLSGVE